MNTTNTAVSIISNEPVRVEAIADGEIFMIEPRKLRMIAELGVNAAPAPESVNPRLVDSMLTNGFDMTRPLLGAWTEVAGGTQELLIIDGARRAYAALVAIEKGANFKEIPVRVTSQVFPAPR